MSSPVPVTTGPTGSQRLSKACATSLVIQINLGLMTLLLIHRANSELSQDYYMEHCKNERTRGQSLGGCKLEEAQVHRRALLSQERLPVARLNGVEKRNPSG